MLPVGLLLTTQVKMISEIVLLHLPQIAHEQEQ